VSSIYIVDVLVGDLGFRFPVSKGFQEFPSVIVRVLEDDTFLGLPQLLGQTDGPATGFPTFGHTLQASNHHRKLECSLETASTSNPSDAWQSTMVLSFS
jgi:hypothetical protein